MAQSTCSAEGCERPRRYRVPWCNKHRQRVRKHGNPDQGRWPDKMTRVMRRVQKGDGCWLWTGAFFSKTRYGQVWADGTTRVAHRVVYELLVGEIPEGLEIDHLCRVRACVNPGHLEAVTTAENMRRMHAAKKGR